MTERRIEDVVDKSTLTDFHNRPETDAESTDEDQGRSSLTCPACGSENIDHDPVIGEHVCADCHTVVDEKLPHENAPWERRSAAIYANDVSVTTNTDAGMNGNALGGRINWADKDAFGQSLSSDKRAQFARLRALNSQADQSPDRAISRYLRSELIKVRSQLSIPDHIVDHVVDTVYTLITSADTDGFSLEAIADGTLAYYTLLISDYDITLDTLAEHTYATQSEINRMMDFLLHERHEYIDTLCTHTATAFNLPDDTIEAVRETIGVALDANFTDHYRIPTIVATAVYAVMTANDYSTDMATIQRATPFPPAKTTLQYAYGDLIAELRTALNN